MNDDATCIVVSDFDGTITSADVTDLVWERYLPDAFRAEILAASKAGAITAFELIRRGYAEIACPPDELLALARAAGALRPGFPDLVGHCRARGWPLVVVSNGLRLYIEALLPPGIPVAAYEARHDPAAAGWQVSLPPDVALAPGEDFKVHVLGTLRRRHPRATAIYVGDGRLDFEAARRCDRIFAVRGSPLATLCRAATLPVTEFDSFSEVANLV